MPRKIPVKYVKSYKDIPGGVPKGTIALFYHPSQTIYAIRGRATAEHIMHERYHAQHPHPHRKRGMSASEMVLDEMKADMYAHRKVGKTHGYSARLGFLYGLIREKWGSSPLAVMRILKQGLEEVNAPRSWRESYNRGLKQLERKFKGRYSDRTIQHLRL